MLSLAKMELENFYKNVIPVSEYFDQSGLLSVVNGERNPGEVYKDFRSAVFEILGSQDNQNALLNGVVGMGRGVNEIPGSIVTVETAPWQQGEIKTDIEAETSEIIHPAIHKPPSPIVDAVNLLNQPPMANNNVDFAALPPIIWVIGGPGSNKSTLCLKAVALNPGWSHFRFEQLHFWIFKKKKSLLSINNFDFRDVAVSVVLSVQLPNLIQKRILKIIKSKIRSLLVK